MAQMKTVETVVAIKDERAFWDEVQKESKTGGTMTQESSIRTGIINFSKRAVSANKIQHWRGGHPSSVPDIQAGNGVILLLLSSYPDGVKFGVEFVDSTDDAARKFVIAVDTGAGKVYVETGPTGQIDWNAIEEKLDNGTDRAEYDDPILGGKMIASIVGNNSVFTFNN